jgi:hypothetical protein
MTEQEKQAIRELARNMPPYYSESKAIFRLLDALGERDREIYDLKLRRGNTIEDMIYFQEENQRLRNALEFYADKFNYPPPSCDGEFVSPAVKDRGEIARQALTGEEKFFKGYKPYEYFKVGESE